MTGRFARLNVGLYFPAISSHRFFPYLIASFTSNFEIDRRDYFLITPNIRWNVIDRPKRKRITMTILAPLRFSFHLISPRTPPTFHFEGDFLSLIRTGRYINHAAFQSPPYRDGSRAQTRSVKSINCRELALSL